MICVARVELINAHKIITKRFVIEIVSMLKNSQALIHKNFNSRVDLRIM